MNAIKPKLNSIELREKVNDCFKKGGDFYLNKEILEFFNTRMKTNTNMRVLGKALISLGFKRSIIKHEGKTKRCYYLSPKQW